MRRTKPLGDTWIPILPVQGKQTHLQLIHPPPTAPPIRHQIWSSHLKFRRLSTHSVPRVPEDAGERQGKIVSWLPARGKRGEGFWNIKERRGLAGTMWFCFVVFLMPLNFRGTQVFHLTLRDVTVNQNSPPRRAPLFQGGYSLGKTEEC